MYKFLSFGKFFTFDLFFAYFEFGPTRRFVSGVVVNPSSSFHFDLSFSLMPCLMIELEVEKGLLTLWNL